MEIKCLILFFFKYKDFKERIQIMLVLVRVHLLFQVIMFLEEIHF